MSLLNDVGVKMDVRLSDFSYSAARSIDLPGYSLQVIGLINVAFLAQI